MTHAVDHMLTTAVIALSRAWAVPEAVVRQRLAGDDYQPVPQDQHPMSAPGRVRPWPGVREERAARPITYPAENLLLEPVYLAVTVDPYFVVATCSLCTWSRVGDDAYPLHALWGEHRHRSHPGHPVIDTPGDRS